MKDYLEEDPVIMINVERKRSYTIQMEMNIGTVFVSSIWLKCSWHQVPELDDAIREQLNKISHSTMLGLANVPSIFISRKNN